MSQINQFSVESRYFGWLPSYCLIIFIQTLSLPHTLYNTFFSSGHFGPKDILYTDGDENHVLVLINITTLDSQSSIPHLRYCLKKGESGDSSNRGQDLGTHKGRVLPNWQV